jgi:predicted nucleic acid-binding protein
VIVVDASVLAVALGDDGADGSSARGAVADEVLAAPELIDLEVLSVWRRQVAAGKMPSRRAALAVSDLAALRLRRMSNRLVLQRCWELRRAVTVYDAAYVALAEAFAIPLLTADARLSRAAGLRCEIKLVN